MSLNADIQRFCEWAEIRFVTANGYSGNNSMTTQANYCLGLKCNWYGTNGAGYVESKEGDFELMERPCCGPGAGCPAVRCGKWVCNVC